MRLIRKPAHVSSEGPENPRTILHYQTYEETDSAEVRRLVKLSTPDNVMSMYGNLLRGEISLDQIHYNQFDVDVEYVPKSGMPLEAGDWSWHYNASGVEEHITHSLETVAKYPVATAPDFKRAIGVENGEVKGVNIINSQSSITVRFQHPNATFTLSYANFIDGLVGCSNSTTFLGRPAGEVRFAGFDGSDGSDSETEVSYVFELRQNEANLTVGDVTGVSKDGWDVSWTQSKRTDVTVGATKFQVVIPQFVYIERVKPRVDFQGIFGFG